MTKTSTSSLHPTIAVLGGTGRTGRRVADRLRSRGLDVRIGSRAGAPSFHWERPETWAPVLNGCTAAYIAYSPDLTFPGAVETVGMVAEQARQSGLNQLVLLSGRGEDEAQRGEAAVRAAGVPTAVLRSSMFSQNFSEHFFHGPILDGVIEFPAGDMPEPFLDIDDLADVADRLLAAAEPLDMTLDLTGPRLLTFTEAAAEISEILGRPVTYQSVSVAEFVEGAVDAGAPREEAEGLGIVFAQIFDGRNAHTTDHVERVLGRPAGDFTDYVRRAAASGAWNVDSFLEVIPS